MLAFQKPKFSAPEDPSTPWAKHIPVLRIQAWERARYTEQRGKPCLCEEFDDLVVGGLPLVISVKEERVGAATPRVLGGLSKPIRAAEVEAYQPYRRCPSW